jgi:RNA polymerase sigma factor (sigma-70 family)
MKKIDYTKTNELLTNLIIAKKRYKRNNSKINSLKYNEILSLCVNAFDFLVKNRTKRYYKFSNYEDLVQEGRIALISALNTYDNKKGNFYIWAKLYINTKVSRQANCHSTVKIPIKAVAKNKPKKVDMPVITDNSKTAFESLYFNEMKDIVLKAISKLPGEQQKILELNNYKYYSINKICDTLDISRGDCLKLLKQAHKSLKISLSEYNQ